MQNRYIQHYTSFKYYGLNVILLEQMFEHISWTELSKVVSLADYFHCSREIFCVFVVTTLLIFSLSVSADCHLITYTYIKTFICMFIGVTGTRVWFTYVHVYMYVYTYIKKTSRTDSMSYDSVWKLLGTNTRR